MKLLLALLALISILGLGTMAYEIHENIPVVAVSDDELSSEVIDATTPVEDDDSGNADPAADETEETAEPTTIKVVDKDGNEYYVAVSDTSFVSDLVADEDLGSYTFYVDGKEYLLVTPEDTVEVVDETTAIDQVVVDVDDVVPVPSDEPFDTF